MAATWFRFIPLIFILALALWSAFVYLGIVVGMLVKPIALKIFLTVLILPSLVMLVWSYLKTCFEQVPVPPQKFSITQAQFQDLNNGVVDESFYQRGLPIQTHTGTKNLRLCRECCIIKPDRCHHCSVLKRCVMKYDHFCPWVCNAVGFHNIKYFILFLFYGVVYLSILVATLFYFFIEFVSNPKTNPTSVQIIMCFFLGCTFLISVGGMLLLHIYLLLQNMTTLESSRRSYFWANNPYQWSLSTKRANFEQVFGLNWRLWFLPVPSSLGDGSFYPVHHHIPVVYVAGPSVPNIITTDGLAPWDSHNHPKGDHAVEEECEKEYEGGNAVDLTFSPPSDRSSHPYFAGDMRGGKELEDQDEEEHAETSMLIS